MIDNLTAYERETVINMSDGDAVARIWTAQRRVITTLRNSRGAREVRSGYEGTTEWAEFEIPQRDVRFHAKRRVAPVTPEQSAILAARLRKANR